MTGNKSDIIIACSKLWDPGLIERISQKSGRKIHLVQQKEQLNLEFLNNIKPEYVFFPHWSFIVPQEVFLKHTCVIFHMTDLPFGRGGSPLQNLIQRKIRKTKISALKCEQGIDAGPVYLKKDLDLSGKASEIFLRASLIIESMILDMLNKKMQPIAQTGEIVEFKRRTPEQSNLASLNDLESVYDYIRMLDADGYPRSFIRTENLTFEFSDAQLEGNEVIAKVRIIKNEK